MNVNKSKLLKILLWGGEAVLFCYLLIVLYRKTKKQKGKVELELCKERRETRHELGEVKNTFIKHEQSVSG